MSIPALLAVDASGSSCSIALQLADAKHNLSSIPGIIIENTQLQAALLLPNIERLLIENNTSLAQLDALVLSHGPGRFTGLRISNSCIQGLAYCSNKKILTVNSLQVYAQQFTNQHTIQPPAILWVCTKAYGDNYYQAKYSVEQGITFRIEDNLLPYIKSKSEILSELQQAGEFFYLGTGWHDILDASDAYKIYAELTDIRHCFKLANREFESHNLFNAYDVLPLYGVNPYK